MIAVCPILYVGYKIVKKTKILHPKEVDLRKNMDEIDEYERSYGPQPAKYVLSLVPSAVFALQYANKDVEILIIEFWILFLGEIHCVWS